MNFTQYVYLFLVTDISIFLTFAIIIGTVGISTLLIDRYERRKKHKKYMQIRRINKARSICMNNLKKRYDEKIKEFMNEN